MKDFPWVSLMSIFGCFLIILLFNFFSVQYKYNNSITTLSEVVRVAGYNSYDYSMRAKDGELIIQRDAFEEKVKSLYTLDLGYRVDPSDFKFDFEYLYKDGAKDQSDTSEFASIKALKVTVQYRNEQPYEMTYVANIQE